MLTTWSYCINMWSLQVRIKEAGNREEKSPEVYVRHAWSDATASWGYDQTLLSNFFLTDIVKRAKFNWSSRVTELWGLSERKHAKWETRVRLLTGGKHIVSLLSRVCRQWDILVEIVRRFICGSHSRRVYGRAQMMALTSAHGTGLAYKYWNVTSHDFRCSVMYAD